MNKKLGLLLALLSLAGAGLVRAGAEHQHIGHQHAGHEHAGHQHAGHEHVGHRHGGHHHGRMSKNERAALIAKYHDVRKAEYEHDVASGMYADLYKSPAWPTAAQFFENKDLLNVQAFYNYAQDCYDSKGYSSGKNVTNLFFGEDPLTAGNLFLASSLLGRGANAIDKIHVLDGVVSAPAADQTIAFIGKTEAYGLRFDFARYLIAKSLACGIELPVVYKRNKLDSKLFSALGDSRDVAAAFQNGLAAKGFAGKDGFPTLGGSAAGLGDVALFINGQFDSKHFDKLVTGMRIQFPTGKKASQFKLWAPDLGNGGFSEIAAYTNMVVSYKQCLNPHLSIQGGFSLPAHVDRRIPKIVTIPVKAAGTLDVAADTAIRSVVQATLGVVGAPGVPVAYVIGDENHIAAAALAAVVPGATALDLPSLPDPNANFVTAVEHANNVIAGAISQEALAIYRAALRAGIPVSTLLNPDQKLALANRIVIPARTGAAFAALSQYDSLVNNMGDTVTTVKMIRGPELKVRLGNMVEHCFMRRGFLDMFYDLRIKGRDYISGVSADDFNIELLRKNSYQVEHRLGLDYSYQFDLFTRARLGLAYTVAGKNVPKALDLSGSLNCAF